MGRLESIMLKIFVIILFQNSSQTYYYSIEILCYYAHIMLKNSIISTLFGKQQQSVLVFTQRQLYWGRFCATRRLRARSDLCGAFKTSSRDLH